jgi:hypothetical protein
MEALIVLLLIVAIDVAAVRFGADSRETPEWRGPVA